MMLFEAIKPMTMNNDFKKYSFSNAFLVMRYQVIMITLLISLMMATCCFDIPPQKQHDCQYVMSFVIPM